MKFSVLIYLLISLALLGCEGTKTEDTGILARVGDATITTTDLESEIQRRKGNRQPTTDSASVLRELVLRAALLEKSRRLGLDQDSEIKRTIENLMIARLKEAELSSAIGAVEVSEEELEDAYVQRSTEFRKDERRRLAILMLKLNPHRPQQLNDQIIERIKTARQTALKEKLPEGFGALAIRTSDDQASRYKGGGHRLDHKGKDTREDSRGRNRGRIRLGFSR
ncbi:MAG: hypothetical protein KDN22_08270 [Verrucomicrobiae bacterium]|nr:hypothetical protein [Verrucomicrobiae bacterium]